MPNQALPALSRCGIAFTLLLCASCGKEREPWYGFELFPADEAPADGSAGSNATATSSATAPGESPSASTSDTSVGTESPGASAAAASGESDRATPSQTGVQTAAPDSATTGTAAAETATPGTAPSAPKSFRITELQLRDPHVFAGTQDLTEQEVLGQSVNRTLIPAKLTKDADGDGSIDVSVVAILDPFDPSASPGVSPTLTFVNADCPVNAGANGASSACKPLKGAKGLETTWTLEHRPSGNCMEPMQGTTSNYQPAIAVPNGPCFLSTSANDFPMDLGGIKVQVTAGRVSATYQAQPASLVRGLLAGFVTRAAAMEAKLPSDAGPMVAGDSLSTYIRARDYDQSASPNGQDGFWMYLNFVAKPIEYTP